MTVPLPGWYPDPSGAAAYRWWDGNGWTDAIGDDADIAPPHGARPVAGGAAQPTGDAATATGRTPGRSAVGAENPGSAARSHRLVALVVAVTLVVSGGVVGMIGWRSFQSARSVQSGPGAGNGGQHGTQSGQPSHPGASAAPSGPGAGTSQDPRSGRLDEVTRSASLGTASMALPGEPYELVGGPITIPGVFDAMFVANAPVHPDFNGSDTWAATVGIGHIPAGAWDQDDLPAFGRKALNGISQQFFGYNPTSVQKLGYRPVLVGTTACAEITADVHYAVKGLASTFDRVRIVGCPDGTDGSVVAAVSSVPNDASARVTRLAERSLAGFTVG